MQIELWVAFVVASIVLLAIPGPTTLTVLSYSAVHGRRSAFPLVAGVALGDSTAILLSLVGLGAPFAITALNPKAIVFFVAFLPQFVSPDYSAGKQLTILAATFVAFATLNACLYSAFAVGGRFCRMPKYSER